jgi:hypothetical protein
VATPAPTTPSPALKMSSGNSTMWKMLETADTARIENIEELYPLILQARELTKE